MAALGRGLGRSRSKSEEVAGDGRIALADYSDRR
jgi:hypothetical protein